jgi:hypothetical protein
MTTATETLTFDELRDKLMPMRGNCGNLEGEVIRAINRIEYRHWNDGDWPTVGYGRETQGPALAFITRMKGIPGRIKEANKAIRKASHERNEKRFLDAIEVIKEVTAEWVNAQMAKGDLEPNNADIWDPPAAKKRRPSYRHLFR